MGDSLLSFHFVNMNAFVSIIFLAVSSLAAPAADPQLAVAAKPYINQGSASGPLTPAVGDLVATPNGYRSLALEGFSEDLNQDGFVDPIGQAVVPVVQSVAAPVVQTVAAPAVAAVKAVVPAATVKAAPVVQTVAAPAVAAYSVPVAHHVGYQVHHTVQHVPQVTVQKHVKTYTTHHVINHAPVVGAFTGLVPAVVPVAAAEPAEAEAAPAVEEA